MTRSAVAWLALVVPVGLVLALCAYWVPVMRDGWGLTDWHMTTDVSLATVWEYARANHAYNNPRLGQVLSLLLYTPGPVHAIVAPVLALALFYLLGALVLGRWPSLRRTDDALLCATIVAMVLATARALGPMLVYQPYVGNYVFGLVLGLAWLVPYRFHAQEPRERRWWWIPIMAIAGVAAGLCNEHTAPTIGAAGAFAIAIYWRRGERFVPWALAGQLGFVAGSIILFSAPGQDNRYLGLAAQQSLVERIIERGIAGNSLIILLFVAYVSPLLVWGLLGYVARRRHGTTAQPRSLVTVERTLLAMAILIVLTLLASPKQGERLYFASICLSTAAAAGWVLAQLGSVERRLAGALAALVIAWVSVWLVVTYHRAHREFAARIAVIKASAPGSTVKVAPYSQERSRYFLGEDFVGERVRAGVASMYGLGAVELEPPPGQRAPTDSPASEP